MVKAKVWTLNKKISGLPKVEDFSLVEEDVPSCKDGDVVIEAEFLSVDPYMRYRLALLPVNGSPPGSQVAKVIESRNSDYPVGCYVIGYPGWRSHTYLTKKELCELPFPYMKVPDLGKAERSTALGVFGMPGNTAYFGFLEICKPKAGETVLVNGAAGAVGSLVCQIAKIKGCKVIAFAGSDEKVAWVKDLGVDHVFNYKTTEVSTTLKSVAPKGIDCYFDNVGGTFSQEAVPHMAEFGRISICGAISTYNNRDRNVSGPQLSPYVETNILLKQLRVEGFMVYRWSSRWNEGITQMRKWAEEGKIKYTETVTKGFEQMPKTFIGLFAGENIGKAVIKA